MAATYDNYCGMTELSYAPAALRSDFEQGAKVSGFRAGVMAAQIETESHWRVGVVSSQGAKGILHSLPMRRGTPSTTVSVTAVTC